MKKKAKSIGIKVLVSVSAKTDYLVVGDNVGQKKIAAAEKFNVLLQKHWVSQALTIKIQLKFGLKWILMKHGRQEFRFSGRES
jgi:hypothetical protein